MPLERPGPYTARGSCSRGVLAQGHSVLGLFGSLDVFLDLSFLPPLTPHLSSLRGRKLMTHFLTEHLLFLFAQTMVYTIHEIPIFIAMGVVGKGHPQKDTNPPGPTCLHHSRRQSPVGTKHVVGQGPL